MYKEVRDRLTMEISNADIDRIDDKLRKLELELNSVEDDGVVIVENVGSVQLHIISVKGRLWCLSQDISRLISDWRGWDMLDRMVTSRNMEVERYLVTCEDNLELWRLIESIEAECKDPVYLYLLADVPRIVETFGKLETLSGFNRLKELFSIAGHS